MRLKKSSRSCVPAKKIISALFRIILLYLRIFFIYVSIFIDFISLLFYVDTGNNISTVIFMYKIKYNTNNFSLNDVYLSGFGTVVTFSRSKTYNRHFSIDHSIFQSRRRDLCSESGLCYCFHRTFF